MLLEKGRQMKANFWQKKHFKLVDALLCGIASGALTIELPDGESRSYGDAAAPVRIKVNAWRFFSKLVRGGSVGLGESWVHGDWESADLTGVIELFIDNIARVNEKRLKVGLARRGFRLLRHALHSNSRSGSRRNIHAHYDLGNDFYRTFLDSETMMYSCALFESPEESLAAAQQRKIASIIAMARIEREHHVLEIGCGWGGFAIEAARSTGCRVTGITVSREQYDLARQRVAEEGVEERVTILMSDYRDVQGTFDRIVSIEMLEAVGHAYYGTFMAHCDRLLKPGGRIVLQSITIPDQRYAEYRRNPDWMQKYIFPGGMLPSLTELCKAMTRSSALTVDSLGNIGIHYAETLRRWRQTFECRTEELEQLGYDEKFRRKWIYYLCYCEAGFRKRYIYDVQMVLLRPGVT